MGQRYRRFKEQMRGHSSYVSTLALHSLLGFSEKSNPLLMVDLAPFLSVTLGRTFQSPLQGPHHPRKLTFGPSMTC